MFRISSISLALLFASALNTVEAHAGPMPPCISATLSANGNILVTNQLSFDDPDPTHLQKVRRSTFQIFSRYVSVKGINDDHHFDGPNTYWGFMLWSIDFDWGTPSFQGCPYTLVTDDGEFLVFVGNMSDPALRIYRRRDHPGQPSGGTGPDHGVFVRKITQLELLPPEHVQTMFSETYPQWYGRGAFTFSADNRTLTLKTRWGNTRQIDLVTGAVTITPP
jgi:hypothetical protein